jgi:hypothetical protein
MPARPTVLVTMLMLAGALGCSSTSQRPLVSLMHQPPPPPTSGGSPFGVTDTGVMTAAPNAGSIATGVTFEADPDPNRPIPPRDASIRVEASTNPRTTRAAEARTVAHDPIAVRPGAPPRQVEVAPGAPGPIDETSANDEQVTRGIRVSLETDESLTPAARNVVIETHRGVVTITGVVTTPGERARIDADARAVRGVERVDNRLHVAP